MIIIRSEEFQSRIAQVFPSARFPRVPRSLRVAIVHRKFFEQRWRSWWAGFRRSRGLTYFNPGMCNLIAASAAVEFDFMVNKEAARTGIGDIAGGMVATNLFISAGSRLNNVAPANGGGHTATIVGLTPDEQTWTPFFYEPQERIEEPLSLTTLESAAADFVSVYDVFN